jgi:alpha-L-fucosidase
MLSTLIFGLLTLQTPVQAKQVKTVDTVKRDTPAQHDQRMAWFRNSRFGMFIHWGLYSVPAGYWNGAEVPGAAEWLQYTAKVKPEDYEPLQQQFNPVNFDAKKWVGIAKNAGMKYIVITTKHHEGFAMWPSKLGTWNIGYTQFKRDPLKELAQACKDAGIKLCFYHSIMDWHHPDYLPRRTWDTRDASHADFEAYVKYMKGQLKEILTNYGPIGLVWFDGEWEDTWTHERGKDLYSYIRTLQPNIIVNNRVDTGRSGMAGMTVKGSDFVGDYGTPEQTIPANGIPGQDWESCMTMNDTWGFSAHDHNWKSSTTLIRNLVDCASKGGNYLLNVGPTSLGEIPDASIERLSEVGDWMHKYSESIYGTTASPFPKPLSWGRVTQKPGKMFLNVFDHTQKTIDLPGLHAKIKSLKVLGDTKSAISYTQDENGVHISLPSLPDEASTVLVLGLDGKFTVSETALQQAKDGSVSLDAIDAKVDGNTAQYESGTGAIGYWTTMADTVNWTFDVKKPGDYKVEVELACEPGAEGASYDVEVAGAKLAGKVPNTGGWKVFTKLDLGTVTIAQKGKTTLTVRALTMPSFAVMNLKSVRLSPK